VFVPQIDIISAITALVGHLMDQLNRPHGADLHAGLFAVGAAFVYTISCLCAEVALHGYISLRIPDDPARRIRAGVDTFPAAVTQRLIHDPDVAVIAVSSQCAGGAGLYTEGIGALPADTDGDVIGKGFECTLHDLNPGKGWIVDPFVYQ